MDVFEAIRRRRSVREFAKSEVPEEMVNQILAAAVQAPSAGNLQSWEFVVVRDQSRKEALAQAALDQEFLAAAPVVIAVCANRARSAERYGARGAELYCIQDCAAATQNIMLAATALSLGTCWVGAFHEDQVAEVLELPPNIRPLALVPIGHPGEDPDMPQRLPFEGIVHPEVF